MKKSLFVCLVSLLVPVPAMAFCGFYVGGGSADLFNDATNVVLMREGTRTVLSMQNDYSGPLEDFALVIPVPQVLKKEQVKTLERDIFRRVDELAAPRLVEYWEQDPCFEPEYDYEDEDESEPVAERAISGSFKRRAKKKPVVKIEAKFSVAEYEILILSADDSTGLESWLRSRKYNLPPKAGKHFQPYVQNGSYFFVAKVNAKKIKKDPGGRVQLSPIRFHYDSGDFKLPIRLGLINSRGTQDLIIHVLADNQRYEVGNYPSVTIPTNFELTENSTNVFGQFYAALFDAVIENNPGSVVTEYAWQAGKCDPCPPGSAGLTVEDIMTLGADVLPKPKDNAKFGIRGDRDDSGGFTPTVSPNMVLTRLHARYGEDTVGADLVFKKVEAIVGGRPNDPEYVATPNANWNQFQGRYIIRHRWTGPITCDNPRREVWGGPPAQRGRANVMVANKTAYIEERDLDFEKFATAKIKMKRSKR